MMMCKFCWMLALHVGTMNCQTDPVTCLKLAGHFKQKSSLHVFLNFILKFSTHWTKHILRQTGPLFLFYACTAV